MKIYQTDENGIITTTCSLSDNKPIPAGFMSKPYFPDGVECGPIAKTKWKAIDNPPHAEQVIPTDAEALATVKEEVIAGIKARTGIHINAKYPAYKQRNIIMDGVVADLTIMRAFIQTAREQSNVAEAQVKLMTTLAGVEAFSYTL